MAKTARELVIDSLRTCGAISSVETPNANEIFHGLGELNGLIEQLDLESLWPYTQSRVSFQTVAGKNRYTMGYELPITLDVSRIESTTENIVRILTSPTPHGYVTNSRIYLRGCSNVADGFYTIKAVPQDTAIEIDYTTDLFDEDPSDAVVAIEDDTADIVKHRANRLISCAVLDGDSFRPMKEITVNEYYSHCSTGATGMPSTYSYESTYPYSEVVLTPVPDGSHTVELRYSFKIAELSLDAELSLPSGYYGTLQYQLATLLADHYAVDAPGVREEARKRLARIKRLNSPNKKKARNDFSRRRGYYDGLTDSWGN